MKTNVKKRATKSQKTTTTLIITMITNCASKNDHKRVALKLIKNNNAILYEIKKDRKKLQKNKKLSINREFKEKEKRLMTAINSIINANNSLTNEFINKEKVRRDKSDTSK